MVYNDVHCITILNACVWTQDGNLMSSCTGNCMQFLIDYRHTAYDKTDLKQVTLKDDFFLRILFAILHQQSTHFFREQQLFLFDKCLIYIFFLYTIASSSFLLETSNYKLHNKQVYLIIHQLIVFRSIPTVCSPRSRVRSVSSLRSSRRLRAAFRNLCFMVCQWMLNLFCAECCGSHF